MQRLRRLGYQLREFTSLPKSQFTGSNVIVQEDIEKARAWIQEFKKLKSVPKDTETVSISFSRSSGPGGQNVNKVNSKALLRCSLDAPWIPSWAKTGLRGSPYFVHSTNSLQISSSTSRSQAANVEGSLMKLHSLILHHASEAIPGVTTEDQKRHVRDLQAIEKRRRRTEKDYQSQVKKGRKKAGFGD